MAATAPKSDLEQRIKAEFDARAAKRQETEQAHAKQSEQREKRLEQFTKICDDLKAIWKPRFEEFAKQFGERVKITPTVTAHDASLF